MSKHQLSERVLCKKIALLEGRKQSLEQLASLQPGITDRIEELPSDTLAAARFMVDERWRRIDEHQRCASLKQKMLKQSEKLITLNFGERRYEVIAPPPGIEYRNSPDFADKQEDVAGPEFGTEIVAIAMAQGPRAVFVKCKHNDLWLPIMSPEGVELLLHKGRVGEDGPGGLGPVEENFVIEDDPELVRLREELETTQTELNKKTDEFQDNLKAQQAAFNLQAEEVERLESELVQKEEQARQETAAKEAQLEDLNNQLKTCEKQFACSEAENESLTKRLEAAIEQNNSLSEEKESVKSRLVEASHTIEDQTEQINQLNERAGQLEATVDKEKEQNELAKQRNSDLSHENAALSAKSREFDKYKSQDLEGQLAAMKAKAETVMEESTALRESTTAEHDKALADLAEQVAAAEARALTASAEHELCFEQLSEAKKLIDIQTGEIESLKQQLSEQQAAQDTGAAAEQRLRKRLEDAQAKEVEQEAKNTDYEAQIKEAHATSTELQCKLEESNKILAHSEEQEKKTEAKNNELRAELAEALRKVEALEKEKNERKRVIAPAVELLPPVTPRSTRSSARARASSKAVLAIPEPIIDGIEEESCEEHDKNKASPKDSNNVKTSVSPKESKDVKASKPTKEQLSQVYTDLDKDGHGFISKVHLIQKLSKLAQKHPETESFSEEVNKISDTMVDLEEYNELVNEWLVKDFATTLGV